MTPRGEIDLADAVIVGVGDEEVPAGVHARRHRAVQLGGGGRAAVAAVARGSVAGDGGDHAGSAIHLADAVVVSVGDEEVPGRVHRHALRGRQLGGGGLAAVPAVARSPLPATVVMIPLATWRWLPRSQRHVAIVDGRQPVVPAVITK